MSRRAAQRDGTRRVVHAAAGGGKAIGRRHASCSARSVHYRRDESTPCARRLRLSRTALAEAAGKGADVVEQLVIEEEFRGVDIPDMGITGWVTLTVAQAGTEEAAERWVEPVLRGKEVVPAVLGTGRGF